MRQFALSSIVLATSAGSALAGGVIRDANVSTANHAVTSIGSTLTTYTNTSTNADYIGLNNPNKLSALSAPNSQTGTSADWALFPDVGANLTNTNQLPAASSSGFVSNLQAYRFSLAGNTSAGAAQNRAVFGATSLGSGMTLDTASTYNNDVAGVFRWNNLGTGGLGINTSWRANVEQSVRIIDGGFAGAALQITTVTITRLTAGTASDALPLNLSLALFADVNAGPSFAQTGTTQSNTSGAGEVRIRSSVGGSYAEVWGVGATSFDVGLRSTSATGGLLQANARFFGNGNFSNSLGLTGVSGTSDIAIGLAWTGLSIANVGGSVTIVTGVSLVPTPGVMAVLGLGGLVASRRRRA